MKTQQLHFNTVQYEAVFDYEELQLMLITISAYMRDIQLSTSQIRQLKTVQDGLIRLTEEQEPCPECGSKTFN